MKKPKKDQLALNRDIEATVHYWDSQAANGFITLFEAHHRINNLLIDYCAGRLISASDLITKSL